MRTASQKKKFMAELLQIRVVGFGWDKKVWKFPAGGQSKNSVETLRDHLADLLAQHGGNEPPKQPPLPASDVNDLNRVVLRAIALPALQNFKKGCIDFFDDYKATVVGRTDQHGTACLRNVVADHLTSTLIPKVEAKALEGLAAQNLPGADEISGGHGVEYREGAASTTCDIHQDAPISTQCSAQACPFCCAVVDCIVPQHREARAMINNFLASHFSSSSKKDDTHYEIDGDWNEGDDDVLEEEESFFFENGDL
mmetsp:Transcript_12467/g.19146  ORF Transcript_12467/g.19146 Transcript_12467/m.19146 type:complete len:254 (-) Transcript_12467:20-781(-)